MSEDLFCFVVVVRLSLLRYNTNLTRCKKMMFATSQELKAKLDFFKSSIQYDLDKYSDQMHYGICESKARGAVRFSAIFSEP